MRRSRLAATPPFGIALALALATALAATGACRTATEGTLAITLDQGCPAAPAPVAIVVGGDPKTTEARVTSQFLAATTTSCADGSYGTLVLTPGDGDAAAVVVTIPTGQTPSSSCVPPDYAGCIVARRRFTFVEHASLSIPIVLESACIDHPCDATSTCHAGYCFSSDTDCSSGTCPPPGVTPDGGVDLDAAEDVATDANASGDGGADGGGGDAGPDSGDGSVSGDGGDGGEGGGGGITCNNGVITCNGVPCPNGEYCCRADMLDEPAACHLEGDPECATPKKTVYCCGIDAQCTLNGGGMRSCPPGAPDPNASICN